MIEQKLILRVMDGGQMEILIEQILENSFFRMSIREELEKIVEGSSQKTSLQTPAIHMLVEEIMEHISMVISFKIKQMLDIEYTLLADHCVKINSQLDNIKVRVAKVQVGGRSVKEKHEETGLGFRKEQHSEENRGILSSTQKILLNKSESQNSLKLTKLKQEIDSIKVSLQKYSMKQILGFIAENTQEINNKIDSQCERLQYEIQNTMRNTSILNCKNLDFTGNRYQSIEERLDSLIERFNSFQGLMEQRYEANFKNVWNVITDLGSTVSGFKNRDKQRANKELEEKEGSEKKGLSSFFGWR